MKRRIFLIAVMSTFFFEACSNNSGENAAGTQVIQSVDESKLQGQWRNACQSYGGSGYERSSFTALTIQGTDLSIANQPYNGTACSGSPTDTLTLRVKFEVSSPSDGAPGVLNFDTTLQSVAWVVYDQDTANAFNAMAACGFTDWKTGVEKDITGLSCLSGPTKAGVKYYSIIKATDSSLQFGEADPAHDGTTVPRRHTVLSKNSFERAALK